MPRHPNRRSEHFTIPLSLTEMESLEVVAAAWGRSKTAFARELLLNALNNLGEPARTPSLPA